MSAAVVGVGVTVGPAGVVAVGVGVDVGVAVAVRVGVAVDVAVAVTVRVGVAVGVAVAVAGGGCVAVRVEVGVGVAGDGPAWPKFAVQRKTYCPPWAKPIPISVHTLHNNIARCADEFIHAVTTDSGV